MHDRPPARDRNRDDTRERRRMAQQEKREREERKRKADAKRQREKRERDEDGIISFPGRASSAFIEAMKARAIFFGASKQEAERDANDPKKIADLAFAVLDDWAPNWYSKK